MWNDIVGGQQIDQFILFAALEELNCSFIRLDDVELDLIIPFLGEFQVSVQ